MGWRPDFSATTQVRRHVGGERGIRTLGTLAGTPDFEARQGAADIVGSRDLAHFASADDDGERRREPLLTEQTPDCDLHASDVEAALVRALERASAAAEWDAVRMIADELRARRLVGATVVDLASIRRR